MPPLRERRGDIPLLARFYVNKYNGRYRRDVRLMDSGVRALQDYTWPGNVRQLQHMIERLTILADRIDRETVHDALTAMESREKPVETLADAEEDQIRGCWRRPAATRARPRRSSGSSGRRCTASWSG